MAEFYDGFEIHGLAVSYGKDTPRRTDAALGVIIPSPIKVETGGFRNVLAQLRLQRDTQDPRQVLESAAQDLELRKTRSWNKMLDRSHASQKYAASVSEELTFLANQTRKRAEETNRPVDANPAAGVIRFFNVSCAVESVVYGLAQVYRPQTDFSALREEVTRNAFKLDASVGNVADMYAALNFCYDVSILKQFGVKGGFSNG